MCQATAICAQGTMLAEIFVLRLEAILRFSQEAPASSRFVPLGRYFIPRENRLLTARSALQALIRACSLSCRSIRPERFVFRGYQPKIPPYSNTNTANKHNAAITAVLPQFHCDAFHSRPPPTSAICGFDFCSCMIPSILMTVMWHKNRLYLRWCISTSVTRPR
jgi:hypothetical protein